MASPTVIFCLSYMTEARALILGDTVVMLMVVVVFCCCCFWVFVCVFVLVCLFFGGFWFGLCVFWIEIYL